MTRRPEHRGIPFRLSPRGVRRKVLRAQIGFRFHDVRDHHLPAGLSYQELPEEIGSDVFRGTVIKITRQFPHGVVNGKWKGENGLRTLSTFHFQLSTVSVDIYSFLQRHRIPFQRFDHEAVFTCEQAKDIRTAPMPGKDTKNLFLRDEKGKRHFLVTVGHEKRADIKALKAVFGVQKLSFGSPERLKEHLGVDPGSVTLLGLVNDPGHRVEFFIDQALWDADAVCCHPLVNTATLCIPHAGLEKFLQATGHAATVIDVPAA